MEERIRFTSPFVVLFATLPASVTPLWLGMRNTSTLTRSILSVLLVMIAGAMLYGLIHMIKHPPYLSLASDRLTLGRRDYLLSELDRVEFKQRARSLVIRRRGKQQIAYSLHLREDALKLVKLMERWSAETGVPFEVR